MTKTITHSPIDIIVSRWDDKNILESQANNLLNYLPGWEIFEPFPNGGSAPIGSYTKLFSPIFQKEEDNLTSHLQVVYSGISQFISDLNKTGKGISNIECWLEQSDEKEAVPHPSNSISGNEPSNSKYIQNGDYKNCKWVFNDTFKTEDEINQTVFLNKTLRQINNVKVTKKYYVLKINSSWLSI